MNKSASQWQSPEMARRLNRRYVAERRFRVMGVTAITVSLAFLAFLLFTMLKNGLGGIDWAFLTGSDSTNAANAGIWSSFKGSLLTMAVTLVLSFPLGVLSAIWLEEFAPRARWVEWIEVSINNLAAVPSIIFGLLGLAIFIQLFGMPRSSPLVGGMTLALMTMPVIVIAARNAIQAVPPSIRDAALAVGASPVQATFHHVLPLALPGILTGTIIGMARALGETAPLLIIGMRMFAASPPQGITDSSTVLPMQISCGQAKSTGPLSRTPPQRSLRCLSSSSP